jgi:hypothetical protein
VLEGLDDKDLTGQDLLPLNTKSVSKCEYGFPNSFRQVLGFERNRFFHYEQRNWSEKSILITFEGRGEGL